MTAYLEHANITVQDPNEIAALFCELFDWKIRWSGEATQGGYTAHVGSDTHYLAFYTQPGAKASTNPSNYSVFPALNHIAIVVDDLPLIKQRVSDRNLRMGEHYHYEPGERFYFYIDSTDTDGSGGSLEVEVVCYH